MDPGNRDKEREQLSLKKLYDWHALALLALITALAIIIAFVFWLRLSVQIEVYREDDDYHHDFAHAQQYRERLNKFFTNYVRFSLNFV